MKKSIGELADDAAAIVSDRKLIHADIHDRDGVDQHHKAIPRPVRRLSQSSGDWRIVRIGQRTRLRG